jgi:ubiquinone/menaquinone biosynthesis C-methylase UbiE
MTSPWPHVQVEGTEGPLDAFEKLRPIMEAVGAKGTAREFYWAVNSAFHKYESGKYDELHVDMYAEEEMVWEKLLSHLDRSRAYDFLDVGCGTGLVGELLNRICPKAVRRLTMLDPSAAMLERAKAKCARWSFPCVFAEGDISAMGTEAEFDVLTVNSVLHHIVELDVFCRRATELLRPLGLLLTAQDPRAGAYEDAEYVQRVAAGKPRGMTRVLRHVQWRLERILGGRADEMSIETSRPLLEKGLIKKPMDNARIWAVTDFHVPNQPGGIGKGIDVARLQAWMPSMELLGTHTYDFFGKLWTKQTGRELAASRELFAQGCSHGRELAVAWRNAGGRTG